MNNIMDPPQTSAGPRARTSSSKADRKRPRRSNTLYVAAPAPNAPALGGDDVEPEGFRLEDLQVDEARICESLNSHQRFKVKEGYELKNLPKFDDLTRYSIRGVQELELWKFEVRRLAAAVKSSEPPVMEGKPEWFGTADKDGYNRLHILAIAMEHAVDICTHDNELIMMEHQARLANTEAYARARRRLFRNFDAVKGVVRYDRNIRLDNHHDETYHALVNYVTATVARLLIRTMKGDFWVDNCLSSIAKFAAKMKVVGADLPQAVTRTFEALRDFQVRMTQLARTQVILQSTANSEGQDADKDSPNAKRQTALRADEDTAGSRYFVIMDTFRHSIRQLLSLAIADLTWNEEFSQTADKFETSAIIYNTGFRGFQTQLCQERDGAIGATSDRSVIRCANVAFDVCREVWTGLAPEEGTPGHRTSLDWNWTGLSDAGELGKSEPGHKSLGAMKDVITALVPYLMFCGLLPSGLADLAMTVSLISDPSDPVRYYARQQCVVAARVRTSQYTQSRSVGKAGAVGEESSGHVQNVYDTTMAKELALAGMPLDEKRPENRVAAHNLRRRYRAINQQFREAEEKLQDWIIDERSIIVSNVWYSWIVLAGVGLLTASGVALVVVQDRIAGVDPSNLTVLIWTAAGVLMVYFKSMRVENWPWRDFLRGRVVCRSVSEVKAVTNMDAQTLLAILMRHESRMFLNKRGPFNNLFARKSEDGFAIDVPPRTTTAIAGGNLFVRVNSLSGPALVGLENHLWEGYESISPKGMVDKGTTFICRDFSAPGRYGPSVGRDEADHAGGSADLEELLPLYPICTNRLNWYRVQGVFVERALFD